ncbi:MAG TPA: Ku protein [Thermoanaerobaculia bacterium]|nr:Ku protein [Thermoanaerobaculia bacterium]
MSARAMGSATISFGLVAIPVKLYGTGESSSGIRFNMLHAECGTRVQSRYYCPTHDRYVERDEIAKGYEFARDQYVLFGPEELKALQPEPTNAIEITEFVPLDEVDPIFFEKSTYLGPDKGGAKPYRLLSKAMRDSNRAALARYAARGKDYLVLLRPYDEGLLMQTLRYADEIRAFSEVPVAPAEVQPSELDLALRLIEQISAEQFQPEQYQDTQRQRTMELIERKIEGESVVAPPAEAPKAQIIDLMAALKASLGEPETDKKPARRSPRKPAAKPAKKARKA